MFAVIYLADFPLQAVLRHTPERRSQPVALLDPELPRPVIIQSTPSARTFGVVAGLTTSQALARCPRLSIVVRSAAQEQAATEILLQTADAFSPRLESTRPGVCTMELRGLDLDHPAALQTWSKRILQMLDSLCFEARVGVAATPDLALLAAHPPALISIIKDSVDFIAGLPVAALTPPPDIAEILSRWGIRTIGEFLALGKTEVSERLGPGALELFNRVSPEAIRPLKLVSPPELFSEQIEFENEIETAPPLLLWLRRFVEQLARRLEAVYLVVAQLQLRLGLVSGAHYEHVFKIPSPTGDVHVLGRMLQTHLETLRTDSPIVSLHLAATPARPELHQFGLFQNTLRNPNQFADTLARLVALVGSENTGTPVPETTHRPDAFRLQPPNFEFVPAQNPKTNPPGDGLQFRRFRPPLPAQFDFVGEQLSRIRSKIFTGQITGLRGPFLCSGNWWDDSRWAREEWDAETTDGQLMRLFRTSAGCFVEGVYD